MKKTKPYDPESLFILPWSAANNANGWIEPTTHCQLKCPGCYRGVSQNDHSPVHMDLSELMAEVDFLTKERNVQTISIAGGEPLLYPYLDELISYIRAKDIKIVVLTNGLLLDESRLVHLKEKGVDCFLLHLDKFQGRSSRMDEAEVNLLRAEFCELFRKVRGVQLGFIMPASLKTLPDMDILAPFFMENADIVEMITFTVYREALPLRDLEPIEDEGDISPILEKIKSAFGLSYCALIPKLYTDDAGWIYASTLYRNGKPWKRIKPETFAAIQKTHLKKRGKYQFTPFEKRSQRLTEQGVYSQTLIVVNPPVWTNQGWNLCKGCPDAMVYQGRLVPSCLLERIKQGADIQVFQGDIV